MIIQIRGTSGSGKSTVMRTVMAWMGGGDPGYLANWTGIMEEGRRKPLYYILDRVAVLGHYDYETPCGGCDTVGSARQVFELIDRVLKSGDVDHVLCEGLLLSEDTKWTSQFLIRKKILFLHTDVEECIRRIKKRREEAGNDKPLNEKNTRNRVKTIERAREKLVNAGVYCRRVSCNQAPGVILDWLEEVK